MRNGAYSNLTDAVRHHLSPIKSLWKYDPEEQLFQEELQSTVVTDSKVLIEITRELDIRPMRLSQREVRYLVSFLNSLTVPDLENRLLSTIPDYVPSGLLEDGIPEEPEPDDDEEEDDDIGDEPEDEIEDEIEDD